VIIVVLCVAIVCVTRSYKKGKVSIEYDKAFNDTTKVNTAITIEHNPSYDIIKTNKVDYSSDVPITPNLSYGVTTKPYSKATEDDYNYVQSKEFNQHTDLDKTIKLDINPSYGISRGKDKTTVAFSETVTKSNTKAHDSSHNATITQCNYDYVHDDRFLHQDPNYETTHDVTTCQQDDTLYIQIYI